MIIRVLLFLFLLMLLRRLFSAFFFVRDLNREKNHLYKKHMEKQVHRKKNKTAIDAEYKVLD